MKVRYWLMSMGCLMFGAFACELVVGKTDLDEVRCLQKGKLGPPACRAGEFCSADGVCRTCQATESDCSDGTDNNCDGRIDGEDPRCSSDASIDGTAPVDSSNSDDGVEVDVRAGDESKPAGDARDVVNDPIGDNGRKDVQQDTVNDTVKQGKRLGEECEVHSECSSDLFCAPGLYSDTRAAGTCTRSCCRSEDCEEVDGRRFVCIPGYGGNVCVDGNAVTLSTVGDKLVGDICSKGSECRSGKCSGYCYDTCCTDTDCTVGKCAWFNIAFPPDWTEPGWRCTLWSADHTAGPGSTCEVNGDCMSSLCHPETKKCLSPCTGRTDTSGCDANQVCGYTVLNGKTNRHCLSDTNVKKACYDDSDCDDARCLPVDNDLGSPPWQLFQCETD